MDDYAIFDAGDVKLALGNTVQAMDDILSFTRQILAHNKRFVMIGGEHLVSLPTTQAIHEKHPNLHVIHIDAHTDLREDYMGEKLSHAAVIRRCHEFLGDDRIYQFGIRSGTKEEFEWAKEHTHLKKFTLDILPAIVEQLKDVPVYITIDLDVLDPSVLPGTGTPEPGGISYKELLGALYEIPKVKSHRFSGYCRAFSPI